MNYEQKCWSWSVWDEEIKTNTRRVELTESSCNLRNLKRPLLHPLPCNKALCWTKRSLLEQCESILPVPSSQYRANISLIPIMTQRLPAITALLMHELLWCSNRQVRIRHMEAPDRKEQWKTEPRRRERVMGKASSNSKWLEWNVCIALKMFYLERVIMNISCMCILGCHRDHLRNIQGEKKSDSWLYLHFIYTALITFTPL